MPAIPRATARTTHLAAAEDRSERGGVVIAGGWKGTEVGGQGQIAGALTAALQRGGEAGPGEGTPPARRNGWARIAMAPAQALMAFGILGFLAYALYIAAGSPPGPARFFDLVIYHVPIAAAAAICLLSARGSRRRRIAWGAIGLGLLAWLIADLYYVQVLQDMRNIPYPSWADLGYLFAIPCLFVGIRLTAREGSAGVSAIGWLDGAIAGLAFACVGAAVLEPALTGLWRGDPAVVATNLAYPVGDLLLLSYVVGVLTLTGLRRSPSLLALGAALLIWAGADALYLYLTATDAYTGGWIDMLWAAGALAIGAAAIKAPARAPLAAHRAEGSVAIPAIGALAAAGVLLLDHWDRASTASVVLGGATLVVAAIRLVVGARENQRLLHRLGRDSVTDPLTGLGNRRRLYADLERVVEEPGNHLALFDLDGFKAYNDAFGHTVGDALLRTFGRQLRLTAARSGRAYRLGGDEFCVVIEHQGADVEGIVLALREALHERAQHFEITASCGVVELGREATVANDALRIADQRMYAEKGDRARVSREQEAHDLLLSVLREHEPDLEGHCEGVAARAAEVAERLGCDEAERKAIARAAQLHDIGKVAIPEAILRKPGPLTDEEWQVMRDHTLIGERILSAVPPLQEVAALVRSSHERWDGCGYPDRLDGEAIPLGSRIIFVCDAFDAMTEDRAYQPARSREEALRELRSGAGSQFDPQVVEAFTASLDRAPHEAPTAAAVAS